MMTRSTPSSFGTTRRRAGAASRSILPSASVAIALTIALLGLATSSCSSDKTLIVGTTAQDLGSLTVAAGDAQVGTVGSMLPTPITAKVLTQGGQGVPGVSVQWTFPSGGGSLTLNGPVSDTVTSVTDKQGATSVYWQLDTIAGDQVATATLFGTDQTTSSSSKQVKFHSRGKAGGAATLVVSPDTATLAVGDSTQFSATVLDRWKNPISGATVSWSSSDDSVVSVSPGGLAKAKRAGSAVVIATTSSASTTSASSAPSGGSTVSGQASVSVPNVASATNPPGTVTDLRVVTTTDSSVTLRWTQVDDGTGSPAKYALRYATPTISWATAYATEVSVSGTAIGASEDYTFTGLQSGTTYQFQLVSYRGTLNVSAVFGALSDISTGLTSGSAAPQTPTVTVTPASLSFTSLNATAQLSAVAKDSTGNIVSNPGFTWTSLASSIASVSSSGLVTAKAVGATAIVVAAACCGADTTAVTVDTASSSQATPYFQDGFERSSLPFSQNGFAWTQTNTGSGDSVVISTQYAHSGTHSLKFHYAGKPDLQDGWAEQRFVFASDAASAPSEFWIDYYLRFPANFVLRKQSDGATNDKFLAFWAGTYGDASEAGGDLEYEYDSGGTIVPHLNLNGVATDGSFSPDAAVKLYNLPFFDPTAVDGTWVHVQVHLRLGNGAGDPGVYECWLNGVLKFRLSTWNTYSSKANYLLNGYLMGWANSGFTNNTDFYIDDLKVYKTNPGW